MLLKLARAAFNRGFIRTYDLLFSLDMAMSRLAGASRRIRKSRRSRQDKPQSFTLLEFGEEV